jgi:GT2 family glycosyltransferase
MSEIVNPSVLALVATYLPDSNLLALVSALSSQGIPVVVSDDASPCTADPVLRDCGLVAGVTVIRHDHNEGIARGLNEGLRRARDSGCRWLLTSDQDSKFPATYVADISAFGQSIGSLWEDSVRVGAVGAGVVINASGQLKYPITQVASASGPVETTEEVIASGTLWNVDALLEVGEFDESLGLDAVDAAACLRLREVGYRIALASGLRMEHELGNSRSVRLLGRTVLATGHSGDRRATMMRNRLRLAPAEFKQSPKHAFRTLRRVSVNALLGATVEGDRWKKMKGSMRGLGRST